MDRAEKRKRLKLQDKTVVITGASSGAGRAAALQFAKYGCNLVLAARGVEALNEVEKECRELGAVAIAVETDVSDSGAVKYLAHKAVEFSGQLDVWINNAGVLGVGEFDQVPVEVHEQIIKTNLLGYVYGAYAAMPYFKEQGHGILINNISVGGWFPVPYGASYTAGKFGLVGFSEALRGELTQYRNIHVCDLFPAFLDTPGVQHAANYTGKIVKPAPPVYNPMKVARAMVSVAQYPRNATIVGSVAPLLKVAHAFFPAFTRMVTSKVIEGYLKLADPAPPTTGNVFAPQQYGTSIYGGWNSQADAEERKQLAIKSLAVAGLATGLIYLGGKKLFKQNTKHETTCPSFK